MISFCIVGLVIIGAAEPAAQSADNMSFSTIEIVNAPQVEFQNLKPKSLRGDKGSPVHIKLRSKNPSEPPTSLRAIEMLLSWEGETTKTISTVELKGDVHVEGPTGNITATRGTLDMKQKQLTFIGNVVIDSPQLKTSADEFVMYLDGTGRGSMKGAHGGQFQIDASEPTAKPKKEATGATTGDPAKVAPDTTPTPKVESDTKPKPKPAAKKSATRAKASQ